MAFGNTCRTAFDGTVKRTGSFSLPAPRLLFSHAVSNDELGPLLRAVGDSTEQCADITDENNVDSGELLILPVGPACCKDRTE